jgi:hypothetical protein
MRTRFQVPGIAKSIARAANVARNRREQGRFAQLAAFGATAADTVRLTSAMCLPVDILCLSLKREPFSKGAQGTHIATRKGARDHEGR